MKSVQLIDGPGIAAVYNNIAADNVDAVITVAADADHFWAVDWVGWSYDADPDADEGRLTIDWGGGTTVIEVDITVGGPGLLCFEKPAYDATLNRALVITLEGGGATTMGKVFARVR